GGTEGVLPTPAGPEGPSREEDGEPPILQTGTVKDLTRGDWVLPPTDLLRPAPPAAGNTPEETEHNKEIIQATLGEFGVEAYVVEIASGPTVSRYEVQLAHGIKVSKITGLADNLAMNLAALNVRIEAPIPGKSAIGVEVPNRERAAVGLREILETDLFQKTKYCLPFVLGADVAGTPRIADLAKMPHLLIAGATGSGKSVGLNALITSLLYRLSPDELRLVLIDPKRVELSLYDGIPHLAHPVVKDVKLAAGVLDAVVREMERRYRVLEQYKCKKIESYNSKAKDEDRAKMPYIVVVIDELADLMMQCAKNVEYSICRVAQLSRAVGIHLVVATQRPSVDVITGKIKANIPARIAFTVSSYIDSKTILDNKGAESLIGRGDMLFAPTNEPKPVRIQGCYLSEDDTVRLCDYLKEQREPSYELEAEPVGENGSRGGEEGESGSADELWDDALRYVVSNSFCSTSSLQRKFSIGYTRAARIVDRMEEAGIVGPANGSNRRQVLITEAQLEDYLSGESEQD
ncbi:MAG: DNA translocase FtsK, partial [Abditibacteriota bacterium]|nr:DNA translocase FtsK [Abditibacteriota bacterium]